MLPTTERQDDPVSDYPTTLSQRVESIDITLLSCNLTSNILRTALYSWS